MHAFQVLKICLTAYQWTFPGSCINWVLVAVANIIWVCTKCHIHKWAYSLMIWHTLAISAFSAAVEGVWFCERWRHGSMGTLTALASMRLNQARMVSMWHAGTKRLYIPSSCISPQFLGANVCCPYPSSQTWCWVAPWFHEGGGVALFKTAQVPPYF